MWGLAHMPHHGLLHQMCFRFHHKHGYYCSFHQYQYIFHVLDWSGVYPAAGGCVQAHLMAFSKAQEQQGQQDTSFPCGSAMELPEAGEEPVSSSSSRQVLSAAMLVSGRQHSEGPKQDLVHTQCWGQGLAGLSLPCYPRLIHIYVPFYLY